MTRHDLRLVRMLPLDETLHCAKHGLLNAEETADAYRRAGLTPEITMRHGSAAILERLLDWFVGLTARPHCEYVQ